MHTVFALLCFVVVIHWLIFPYPSGLLHWHCGNLTIAPVPAKQPWWIWINTSMWIHYERLHNHNKAKHNKTVCIFLGIYCMGNGQGEKINCTLCKEIRSWAGRHMLPRWHTCTVYPEKYAHGFVARCDTFVLLGVVLICTCIKIWVHRSVLDIRKEINNETVSCSSHDA